MVLSVVDVGAVVEAVVVVDDVRARIPKEMVEELVAVAVVVTTFAGVGVTAGVEDVVVVIREVGAVVA